MIKRYAFVLLSVAFVFGAAPVFAQTSCRDVNGPGPLVGTQFECNTGGPTATSNFTFYGPSQDSMCYLYPSSGLYKSLGAYGSGYGDFSFTAPDSPVYYYDIRIILDLNNTHFHSGDRVGVLMYNDTDYTVETLGTIDGSGGDICSGTYNFYAIRSAWAGKHMRLSITPWFQDYDSNSKVGYVSISVFDHQTW